MCVLDCYADLPMPMHKHRLFPLQLNDWRKKFWRPLPVVAHLNGLSITTISRSFNLCTNCGLFKIIWLHIRSNGNPMSSSSMSFTELHSTPARLMRVHLIATVIIRQDWREPIDALLFSKRSVWPVIIWTLLMRNRISASPWASFVQVSHSYVRCSGE